MRKIKGKTYKVKIKDLSKRYGIYINKNMYLMENDGKIYNATWSWGDTYYVEGIRGNWAFSKKHLEFVDDSSLETPKPKPKPQLFDISLLDI